MVCLLEIMSQGHFDHAGSPRSSPDLTGWGIQLLLGKQ